MPRRVRCLARDCYEFFLSEDPKCIRICPKCRDDWEELAEEPNELLYKSRVDTLEDVIDDHLRDWEGEDGGTAGGTQGYTE